MQGGAARQTFDGRDLSPRGLDRQHQAGVHRPPVEEDRAGSTLAVVASPLGPGEIRLLAQEIEKKLPGVDLDFVVILVHRDPDLMGHAGSLRGRSASRICLTVLSVSTRTISR